MKIVVIGGTGLVGSQVVALLTEQGHEAVAASPDSGVDTVTGRGLAEVLEGAQVVVDLSNTRDFSEEVATSFFVQSTQNQLAAEQAAGVGHHVILSIVNAENVDSGYMRAKVAQEDLVKKSAGGWSIVRATQFLEFLGPIAGSAEVDGVVHLPHVNFQPIASADISRFVAEVAVGQPLNDVLEVAGPERFKFDDIVRRFLADTGDAREVVADPQAPYFGAIIDDTSLVPEGEARLGRLTYADLRS
jgi:uncharacterized protein YbjT (DUF2867 family)